MNEIEVLSTLIIIIIWIAAGVAWGFAAAALTNLAAISNWHFTPRIIRTWRSNRQWRQFCETHDITRLNERAARFSEAARNAGVTTAETAAALHRLMKEMDAEEHSTDGATAPDTQGKMKAVNNG